MMENNESDQKRKRWELITLSCMFIGFIGFIMFVAMCIIHMVFVTVKSRFDGLFIHSEVDIVIVFTRRSWN